MYSQASPSRLLSNLYKIAKLASFLVLLLLLFSCVADDPATESPKPPTGTEDPKPVDPEPVDPDPVDPDPVDPVIPADTTPPEISFELPDVIGGVHNLVYSVSDDSDISTVKIYIDGEAYAQNTAGENSFSVVASNLLQGSHTFKIEASDVNGNISSLEKNAKVDNEPPVINITSESVGTFLTNSYNLLGTVHDASPVELYVNTSKRLVAIDGTQIDDDISLREGENKLTLKFIDAAGNKTETNLLLTYIPNDGRAPVVSFEYDFSSSGVESVSFEITDDSQIKKAFILIDGERIKETTDISAGQITWDTTLIADGSYKINVGAEDIFGNVGIGWQDNIHIDNTPPEFEITYSGIGANGVLAKIAGTIRDGTTTELFVNGTKTGIKSVDINMGVWESTFEKFYPIDEGEKKTFEIVVTDSFGNSVSETVQIVRSVVDDQAPRIKIDPPSRVSNQINLEFEIIDKSPISSSVLYINDKVVVEENGLIPSPLQLDLTEIAADDTSLTFKLVVEDSFGNAASKTWRTYVDTELPTFKITSPLVVGDASYVMRGEVNPKNGLVVTANGTDASVIVHHSESAEWEVTLTLDEGENTITVNAEDEVGNRVSKQATVFYSNNAEIVPEYLNANCSKYTAEFYPSDGTIGEVFVGDTKPTEIADPAGLAPIYKNFKNISFKVRPGPNKVTIRHNTDNADKPYYYYLWLVESSDDIANTIALLKGEQVTDELVFNIRLRNFDQGTRKALRVLKTSEPLAYVTSHVCNAKPGDELRDYGLVFVDDEEADPALEEPPLPEPKTLDPGEVLVSQYLSASDKYQPNKSAQYCKPTSLGMSQIANKIKGVFVGTPTHDQPFPVSSSDSDDSYWNFDHHEFPARIGKNRLTFVLEKGDFGNMGNNFHVWVDFNKDGTFSITEKVIDSDYVENAKQVTLEIPASVQEGDVLTARVISAHPMFESGITGDPCGELSESDVRDIKIKIVSDRVADYYCEDDFVNIPHQKDPTRTFLYGVETSNVSFFFTANFPKQLCGYASGKIKLPFFGLDFKEFDPVVNGRPNTAFEFPNSNMPFYRKYDVDQLDILLHGPEKSARQYFLDNSGGQLDLRFDIRNWQKSSRVGGKLKEIPHYKHDFESIECKLPFRDAFIDAVVLDGLNLLDYDRDNNDIIDGSVFFIEGFASCWGARANLSDVSRFIANGWVVDADLTSEAEYEDWAAYLDLNPHLKKLYYPRFIVQSEKSKLEEREYEVDMNANRVNTLIHELGHIVLGFSDNYLPKHNRFSNQSLSASFRGLPMNGWEKVLYGQWIKPSIVESSGVYRIETDVIPDGSTYDREKDYVLQVKLSEEVSVYVSHRPWRAIEEQEITKWIEGSENIRDGLTIMSTNKNDSADGLKTWFEPNETSEFKWHNDDNWGQNEVFSKCYLTEDDTGKCVEVELLSTAVELDAEVRVGIRNASAEEISQIKTPQN